MLTVIYTGEMKRDVKRVKKRGKDLSLLNEAIDILASGAQLPIKYCDHPLKGKLAGFRECHLESDWLLIYQIIEDALILVAAGTGTHSDLFNE